MLATYLVAAFAYVFSACSAWALFTAIKHLDPKEIPAEVAGVAPSAKKTPARELRLAS